jgi:antitoxin component of MazEF toxin-antitoxin module
MTTIKKLVRIGDNVALILDDTLLEQIGLDANSEVELSTRGRVLIVTPKGDAARAEAFRNSAQKIIDRYAGLFRRLGE